MSAESAVIKHLDRIERCDKTLHAVISTLDRGDALQTARKLDEEERTTGARGLVHGICALVKDTISTPSLNLPTTCGSHALVNAIARDDATIIKRMTGAGMIVLGKTNVTAFGKASKAGWSAVGGQTCSPYIKHGTKLGMTFQDHDSPSGSSSGSAVAVAASYVSVAISLESEESTVSPSARAGIFGIKATHGSIPMQGIQMISQAIDCVGVMARSPDDILPVLACLQDFPISEDLLNTLNIQGHFKGLRVGMVDPSSWCSDEDKVSKQPSFTAQVDHATQAALATIEASGGQVTREIMIPSYAEITHGLLSIDQIVEHDFEAAQEEYLSDLKVNPANVTTLKEWVAYNEAHAEQELPPDHPSQMGLESCLRPMLGSGDAEQYHHLLKATRQRAQLALGTAFGEKSVSGTSKIDVLLGPADSRLAAVASLAGYPIASMPLGRWSDGEGSNGRCFGIYALTLPGKRYEWSLLRVMKAWERYVRGFQEPEVLDKCLAV